MFMMDMKRNNRPVIYSENVIQEESFYALEMKPIWF